MATGARRPSLARIGAGPGRRGRPESGLWWKRGGLEPRSCSRPARDAAPTIATTPARRVRPRPRAQLVNVDGLDRG